MKQERICKNEAVFDTIKCLQKRIKLEEIRLFKVAQNWGQTPISSLTSVQPSVNYFPAIQMMKLVQNECNTF